MKLSVIVPVYNMAGGNKLQYCLTSLVRQTVPDMEIIAVDDCSTDGSFAILQEFEKENPGRFVALRGDRNRHQGGAKNLGLSAAQGDWIGFIDADDWVTPDYYEKLLKAAEESGADMAGCDYCMTEEQNYIVGPVVHNNSLAQAGVLDKEKYRSLILDSGSLVVKVYRREIILGDAKPGDKVQVFPEDIFYEDNAAANTWMLRAKHFAYLPYEGAEGCEPGAEDAPLYYYLQHASSTVHTITMRRLADRMEAGRCMIAEAKKDGYFEEYKPEIEFSFTVLFYINTLFSAMPGKLAADPDLTKTGAANGNSRYAFVKDLAREMRETFPDFMENPYYKARVHAEEQRLVAMQQRSPLRFYIYYKLLWAYRNFRKKLGK